MNFTASPVPIHGVTELTSRPPIETSPFDLSSLPPLHSFQLVFRALADQHLPPLPTTALHGALGHALKDVVCIHRPQRPCTGCEMLRCCAYPTFFEALPSAGATLGVQDRAPAPWVASPMSPQVENRSIPLLRKQLFNFQVVLIGDRAGRHAAVLERAFAEVARRGLGVGPRRDSRRPPLALETFHRQPAEPSNNEDHAAPPSIDVRFLTPLRLKSGGKIASRIDGRSFASTILRRADLLACLYGKGPLVPSPQLRALARLGEHLSIDDSQLIVARSGRYSSRQQCRIEQPGLVGSMTLSGPDLATLWPLIRFASQVHIGKATSFGFGRFQLLPR